MALLSWPTIACVIYFALNVLLVLFVCYLVNKQGTHEKIKDVWHQRAVFISVLVYFCDTATDVGVLISWYYMMVEEQNSVTNYKSVDMVVFFWTGITIVIFYRISACILMMYVIHRDRNILDLYPILFLLDLYIFKTVHESLWNAKDVIESIHEQAIELDEFEIQIKKKPDQWTNNKPKPNCPGKHGLSQFTTPHIGFRCDYCSKKMKKNTEMHGCRRCEYDVCENCHKQVDGDATTNESTKIKMSSKAIEISISENQYYVQFCESIFESMPQLVLQSVFLIRIGNDTDHHVNINLIVVSAIASLVSVCIRYRYLDCQALKPEFAEIAFKSAFPNCVNYYHLMIVLWRYCNILTRFIVFALLWAVIGGAWLLTYVAVSIILWTIYIHFDGEDRSYMYALVDYVGTDGHNLKSFILRSIENAILLIVICIFGFCNFNCWQCVDFENREFIQSGKDANHAMLIFFCIGCGSLVLEIALYIWTRVKDMWFAKHY